MKVKVFDGGFLPKRAHFDDAGLDFRSPERFQIQPHDSYLLDLRVAVQLPIGCYGKMESKSGLMTQKGVVCAGGVIDSGFRGTIKVRMENHGDMPYLFERGDKVVQMVIHECVLADVEEVEHLDDSVSGRGMSGWGSTGR